MDNVLAVSFENDTHINIDGDFRHGVGDLYYYRSDDTIHQDVDLNFAFYVDNIEGSSSTLRGHIMMFHDDAVLDDGNNRDGNPENMEITLLSLSSTTTYELRLEMVEDTQGTVNGNNTASMNSLSIDTWYYVHMYKVGQDGFMDVYSDVSMTTRVYRSYCDMNQDTSFGNVGGGYFYPVTSHADVAVLIDVDFWVKDLHIDAPSHLATSDAGGLTYTPKVNQTISAIGDISLDTERIEETISAYGIVDLTKKDVENNIVSGVQILINDNLVYSSFWGKSGIVNVTIQTNIDDWLFENEVYELKAYLNNTNEARITLSDTIHTIDFIYQNYTGFRNTAFIQVRDNDGTLINDIVASSLGTEITIIDANITKVVWKFILNQEIVDSQNRGLTYRVIDIDGGVTSGSILGQTYDIYNLGGLVEYDFNGAGTRRTGGDALELQVSDAGDYAEATIYYRKLQHVNMLYDIFANETKDGTYDFLTTNTGIELRHKIGFYYNNKWNDGWEVRINPIDSQVGNTFSGVDADDKSWVELNCRWYYNGTFVKDDNIVIYHNGYDKDNFPTSRLSYTLWLDMWFNKLNASTVIGGRVNGYYNGMEELGTWWFGYGDFRPYTGNVTSSMYFDDLQVNSITIPSTEIEMVRFITRLIKNSAVTNANENYLTDFQITGWKLADDRMQGINTPAFTEPKDITIPKTTLLTPLITAIESIGTFMWNGVVSAGRVLIGAIDSFLLYLGFTVTLSTILNFVGIQLENMVMYITYVTEYASDMTYIFVSMVTWIVSIMTYLVNAIVWIIIWVLPLPIHIITFVVAVLTGGTWTYSGIVWDFSVGAGIMDAFMSILPMMILYSFTMWLFFGGEYEDDIEGMPMRILFVFRAIKDGYNDIFWVFTRMYNSVISLYNFIRSHIPFLSSGGGEQDEG